MNPPNVLFLHAHNTGQYVQPYGHAIDTPHIQRLAEQGVTFRKAFCVSPTCSPSRAAFMTGQWPHCNGMMGLAHRGFRLKSYDQTLVRLLNGAGYETILAGLQHIAPDPSPLGYHHCLETPTNKGADVATAACDYLRGKPKQPFFLDVGINETHRAFPEPDERDDPRYTLPAANLPDAPKTRYDMAGLKAAARIMDDAFGRVLTALDEAGLTGNTFVICLSDHGLQFPGHMCTLTDRGLGTYFILRGPGGFAGGKVVDDMVTHMDVLPTICELAGIDIPDWQQGKSIVPVVNGGGAIHDAVFGEVTYHAGYEPQRCVRTDRWKYIRRYGDRTRITLPNVDRGPSREHLLDHGLADRHYPREALYDLVFDPHENANLIDEPRCADVADAMRAKLDDWMKRTDDPMVAGHVDAPPGSRVCHPDGQHPMDRIMDIP